MAYSQSTGCVNMNGSDDPCYRYMMPAVRVKHEGASKMKKTILVNLVAISEAIGRPMEPLLQHLGQSLSAACKVEGKGKAARAYVAGHRSEVELQEQVFVFIRSFVLCEQCGNPETTLEVAGTKKRQRAALRCGGCGGSTKLDPDLRGVKSLVQHAHLGPVKGHAAVAEPRLAATACVMPGNHAEDSKKQKNEKMRCSCGHKTSKPVCSRCGERVPFIDLRSASQPPASSEIANAEEESPCIAVSRWMRTRGAGGETFSDLLSCMIALGHRVDVPLLAVLGKVFSSQAMEHLKLVQRRIQPVEVADSVGSLAVKWVPLLEAALADWGSNDATLLVLLGGIRDGVAESPPPHNAEEDIFVGMLLAMHQHAKALSDAHMMAACEQLPHRCMALTKFIEFLREDDQDSDTSGTDD